jgi:hypothetical protein
LCLNTFLFNLSSTYEKIEINSDFVWKNQRYSLVVEYASLPFLPLPLSTLTPIFYKIRKYLGPINQREKEQENNNPTSKALYKLKIFLNDTNIFLFS